MRWAVVAHPDDELIFAGGAILSHPHEPWTVVVATHEEGSLRAMESLAARDALRALGIRIDYRFLGHPDLEFDPTGGIDPPILVRQLEALGVETGERVYSHGAPGEYGHRAHKVVHRCVAESLGRFAAVSAFSGQGEVVERIVDPALLERKVRLFDAAYPSQKGVWTRLVGTMAQAATEEPHFPLSDDPADPPHAGQCALAAMVGDQIAAIHTPIRDVLVIGLDSGMNLEGARLQVPGRLDTLTPSGDITPFAGADTAPAGPAAMAAGIARWAPDGERYDLIVCAGVLVFVREFDTVFRRSGQLLRPKGQLILSHEPLIDGHPVNGRSRSMADGSHCYRRPVQAVIDSAQGHRLKIRALKDFVAGQRLGQPVISQIARLERR